jgi:hypothetical protein
MVTFPIGERGACEEEAVVLLSHGGLLVAEPRCRSRKDLLISLIGGWLV